MNKNNVFEPSKTLIFSSQSQAVCQLKDDCSKLRSPDYSR